MPSKKILIVSPSFYPQLAPRAFRTTELVKELARQGHQVTLFTHRDDTMHKSFEKDGVIIKDLGKLKFKKIRYDQQNKYLSLFNRGVRRLILQLFEYPDIELMFLVNKALKAERGYDLLISVAVPFPIHWGVAKALSKNKGITKKWVADCGDPYMGNKSDSFRKVFYFKYIEKWFCRKTDFISVPTEGAVQAYYPEFHSKIKVIPQGFNFDEVVLYNGAVKNDVPTFAYAGSFEPGIRDPRQLLSFLNTYSGDYKFIIYTTNTNLVTPYIVNLKNKIEIRPYVPREELLFELSKMDFLINFNYESQSQTPSKLIDYMLVKRPVLSINAGELDRSLVAEFLNGNYTRQTIIKDIEQYNIKNIAQNFIGLCI